MEPRLPVRDWRGMNKELPHLACSKQLAINGALNTYLAEHVTGRGDVGEEEPPPGTDRPEEPVDDCPVQQEL